MLVLLRQGRISKWFSGIGQEAIAVGATLALDEDEYIMPLHRNLVQPLHRSWHAGMKRKSPLEKLVGFIHIGTVSKPSEDRPRPALSEIVTRF